MATLAKRLTVNYFGHIRFHSNTFGEKRRVSLIWHRLPSFPRNKVIMALFFYSLVLHKSLSLNENGKNLCHPLLDLLVVLFLCCGEDDGMRADPQLQHDVVLGAEHREDAAFFWTETL